VGQGRAKQIEFGQTRRRGEVTLNWTKKWK
jgi:hypothetical protein